MKGKHLVFVGDSVTRYQYLSLISFLDRGRWEEEEEEKEGKARSITYKEGWGETWNDFYNQSSAAFMGREACDCYR